MSDQAPTNLPPLRDQVIAWLNQNNYIRASFDRIISHVAGAHSYQQLYDLLNQNTDIFRPVRISGGLSGLALVNPNFKYVPVTPVQEEVMMIDDLSDAQVAPLETSTTVMPIIPMPSIHESMALADGYGASFSMPTVQVPPPPNYNLPTGEDWKDISSEEWREYTFRNGPVIRVYNPLLLKVSPQVEGRTGGGSHRIACTDGIGQYIPAGWLKITWKAKHGTDVYSF